ncbi:MAG: hypothetical protein NVSMB27_18160 [Ktedonobacteraceae bacterium]
MQFEEQQGDQDAMKNIPPLISVRQLTKYYYMGRNVVPALRGIDLEVERGELVAIWLRQIDLHEPAWLPGSAYEWELLA